LTFDQKMTHGSTRTVSTLIVALALATSCEKHEPEVNLENMMQGEDQTWQFPTQDFRISQGFICVNKSKNLNWDFFDHKIDADIVCTGFRLECAPIMVPGGAYGYDEEISEEPEVMIDVLLPFESLEALEGTTIDLGEPMEQSDRELGSMYLFAVHNDVRWQQIRFGKVSGDAIELEIDLLLNVDYDAGETTFRHTLRGPAKVEKRWE